MFQNDNLAICRELLICYMLSGPSGVYIVEGRCAVDHVRTIKNQIRNEFGSGLFCNSIHAPTGKLESEYVLEKFYRDLPVRETFRRQRSPTNIVGRIGSLTDYPDASLRREVIEAWDVFARRTALKIPPRKSCETALYLLRGGPKSVDHGVTIVKDIMNWSLTDAVLAFLGADANLRSFLCASSIEEVKRYFVALSVEGMRVEIVDHSGTIRRSKM